MPDYLVLGQRYIVTCDSSFLAPDGKSYRGVFGTVRSLGDTDVEAEAPPDSGFYIILGKKTPITIPTDQIRYAVQSRRCLPSSEIYFAD